MSWGSRKIAFASVSRRECVRPSSPSVAYAVTIGIDCEAEATINSFASKDHVPCAISCQWALTSQLHDSETGEYEVSA